MITIAIRMILILILLVLLVVCDSKYEFETLKDQIFWSSLSPSLHIYDNDFVQKTKLIEIDNNDITMLKELIIQEGYVKIDPLFSDSFDSMKALINKLDEIGLPIPFCFIYDEFWLLFMRLHNVIGSILDLDFYRLPDFWAWRIDAKSEQSGWNIHRDKSYDAAIFNDTGMPKSITVWIPLSNVDCTNSCIYVLPANRDPTYFNGNDIRLSENVWPDILPNIRALPVQAGSVLIWNQAIWHWGSKTSSRVTEPRISLSIEFQSRKSNLLNVPVSNPLLFPTYDERLALVAKQILQYQHMYPLDDDVRNLATDIIMNHSFNRNEL